jgi:TonB-dependent SusC/RagA subfamily outer membrane receptor
MKRSQATFSTLIAVFAVSVGLLVAGCGSTGAANSSSPQDDEEISNGYTTQKKSDVTGAVATVSGDEQMERRSARFLSDLLRGSVAGVRVSQGPSGGILVRIRGVSSIYGSNDPLYVVDGMPVQAQPGGALPWINPHDVQSITVLKDAGATAIYGSRGANGVIVITTKSN